MPIRCHRALQAAPWDSRTPSARAPAEVRSVSLALLAALCCLVTLSAAADLCMSVCVLSAALAVRDPHATCCVCSSVSAAAESPVLKKGAIIAIAVTGAVVRSALAFASLFFGMDCEVLRALCYRLLLAARPSNGVALCRPFGSPPRGGAVVLAERPSAAHVEALVLVLTRCVDLCYVPTTGDRRRGDVLGAALGAQEQPGECAASVPQHWWCRVLLDWRVCCLCCVCLTRALDWTCSRVWYAAQSAPARARSLRHGSLPCPCSPAPPL